jgi:hypothetical protein
LAVARQSGVQCTPWRLLAFGVGGFEREVQAGVFVVRLAGQAVAGPGRLDLVIELAPVFSAG